MADVAGARWAELLDEVAGALERLGGEGWIVGGCLRDALLGEAVLDVDVAVTCEPLALAREVKWERPATIARLNRDTVRIGLREKDDEPALQLDLAPLHGGSIEGDLALRDFRVNAMALRLQARAEFVALLKRAGQRLEPPPSLVDPLGGLSDLRERVLVLASETALADDVGRVIRAARLVARFGFRASDALLEAAREVAPRLLTLNGNRVREELNALLALPRAADGLALLAEVGALRVLLPRLAARGDQEHAVASVRATGTLQDGGKTYAGMEMLAEMESLRAWYAAALPDGLLRIVALRWGLLLHAPLLHQRSDEADDWDTERDAEGILARGASAHLATVGHRIAWAVARYGHALTAERLGVEGEGLRSARHLFERVADAGVDVIVAAAACNAALTTAPVEAQRYSPTVGEQAREVLYVYFGERERLVPPRLLSGGDVIREVGVAPGARVGRALREVRRAQLDGLVRTRAEALAWVRASGG